MLTLNILRFLSGVKPVPVRLILLLSSVLALNLTVKAQNLNLVQVQINPETQKEIIDSVTASLNKVYIFEDVAKEMEKFVRKNLSDGKYRDISNLGEFTFKLTEDLRSVSKDKHLSVFPSNPEQEGISKPSPEEQEQRNLERLRKENFGFKKVELLPGNIGYIDFRYFADARLGGGTAIAAMKFLSGADALIFDLRQNGGGEPSMIQLISSYLFKNPVHLNSFYIRQFDKWEQYWSHAYVEGKKMTDVPVFVLTSSTTFSGAEEFSYNLKNLKRGTLIGETTGGGAHPVNFQDFPDLKVGMALPYGRAVNPITLTNWEGTGVEPDIKCQAKDALNTARMEALVYLIEKEEDPFRKSLLEWEKKGFEAQINPVKIDEKLLADYTGVFGPRKIFLENGILFYQREGRPKYRLIPAGQDVFLLEDLDSFRIKFIRDDKGLVSELVGMYNTGESDMHKRSK